MDQIVIEGGKKLEGRIAISGAKNAALPLMCASLLSDEPLTLHNLPHLADIASMANLLSLLGVSLSMEGGREGGFHGSIIRLHCPSLDDITAPYDVVRKMRASVLVLGPLLARKGEARVSLPGGCAIGTRPVDLHLSALEEMGAEIALEEGYIHAQAPKGGLKGADITFANVSVGATENLLMAASLANGTTILRNAAREPEIGDLADCLNAMGAKITGIGSDTLTIEGVRQLHGADHHVLPDRIEVGSYAIAAVITGGRLTLDPAPRGLLGAFRTALEATGATLEQDEDCLTVTAPEDGVIKPYSVITTPFPGFATDMQAQFMTLMCRAGGDSQIDETIFENRFMHVPELNRMGADIRLDGHRAMIHGNRQFHGAPVMATDLRASFSLILAALVAEGETRISRIYHLDRGYERLEEKLSGVGAHIKRVSG